jgi:hypothetical protein
VRLGDPDADYNRGLRIPLDVIHSDPVTGGRKRQLMPIPTRHADVSPGGRTIAYAKYLPHITHWEDFAELMSEMQGELNASHMHVRFACDNPAWDQTAELGIYDDTENEGPGVLIEGLIPGGRTGCSRRPAVPGGHRDPCRRRR